MVTGTDNNQLKVMKATATLTATAGSSRDMTTAAVEGSRVEGTGTRTETTTAEVMSMATTTQLQQ